MNTLRKAAGLSSARNYNELRTLVDDRRIQLRMSLQEADVNAGLPPNGFEKIVRGVLPFAPATFGSILDALGVEIAFKPSSVGIEEDRIEMSPRERLKQIGALGGRISRARRTEAEWSTFCRRAARARWSAVKKRRRRRLCGNG